MKGIKTFICAVLLILCSGFAMYFDLPMRFTVPGLGILIGLCLITLRIGLRASWNGAYKVYVDASDKNKVKAIRKPGS